MESDLIINLPKVVETTLTSIRSSERATALVSAQHFGSLTWADVDIPRVEGTTHFEARCLLIEGLSSEACSSVPVVYRAHSSLPLSDAVDLLIGEDHTGLMAWEGSRQLLRWLAWIMMSSPTNLSPNKVDIDGGEGTLLIELGAGCGFLSVAVAAMIQRIESRCVASASGYGNMIRFHLQDCNTICTTDGSDECVDLIRGNMELHAKISQKASSNKLDLSAAKLWWGDAAGAEALIFTPSPRSSHLIILAGDVVYGIEAVAPLAKASRDLANAGRSASWVLSWMPRCLTKAQNLLLFEALLKEILGSGDGWVLEEVWGSFDATGSTLVRVPPQHLFGPEKSDTTFEKCAMGGCILCFCWVVTY